jgi:hypothetical protein
MPVQAEYNKQYRESQLVNQKYQPLAGNVGIVPSDKGLYSELLRTRHKLFKDNNLLPQALTLVTDSWRDTITAEAGRRQPPLVVVSSDRAEWIKKGIDAAGRRLDDLGIQRFDNASDLRALAAFQEVSPAIYCPARIGLTRQTYVVVHAHEYTHYKRTLAGTGIIVVGWVFKLPAGFAFPRQVTGSGASRYAAIEFCKKLRAAATNQRVAPWDYAWLLDDNVVALKLFPGFAKVENDMTANLACAGFEGATQAHPVSATKTWAEGEIRENRGTQTGTLPVPEPIGLLQQAVLWNIGYLTAQKLNFSPFYLASGEDSSLGKYLDIRKFPYRWYGGLEIRKEQATSDDNGGSKALKNARNRMVQLVADFESGGVVSKDPPPVMIESRGQQGSTVQRLWRFIASNLQGDVALRNEAACRAVEQITIKAMEKGLIADDALEATFKIEPLNVYRVDM